MTAPTSSVSVGARRKVWVPLDIGSTEIEKFRIFVNKRRSLSLQTYKDVHQYSTGDATANDFWIDLFLYLGLKADNMPTLSMAVEVSTESLHFCPLRRPT
jgi:acetoacetyl-CoA synthetase